MKFILIELVKLYQTIFPLFRSGLGLQTHCLYYPSCSDYMIQSIEEHGILHGGWLGIIRLLNCHPFKRSLLCKKI